MNSQHDISIKQIREMNKKIWEILIASHIKPITKHIYFVSNSESFEVMFVTASSVDDKLELVLKFPSRLMQLGITLTGKLVKPLGLDLLNDKFNMQYEIIDIKQSYLHNANLKIVIGKEQYSDFLGVIQENIEFLLTRANT